MMDDKINRLTLFNLILTKTNLINIKFSGLKGQALVVNNKDIPSIREFKDVIPNHYFKCNTIISFEDEIKVIKTLSEN